MRLFKTSTSVFSSLLAFSSIAHADNYQSIQLALTQQNQLFEFDAGDKTLNVQGYRLGYQYGINSWRFSIDYKLSEDKDANRRPQYSLSFKNSGYSLFTEYNWTKTWLALGYSFSQDKTRYSFKRSEVEGGFNLDVDYQNIILDTGYIHATNSGQWTLSSSLSRQQIDENKKAQHIQSDSEIINNNTQIDEEAWMASFGVDYSHYFNLTESWALSIATGLNHQFTLEGEGHIQQSVRRTAISTNQDNTTQVLTDNQSSSTSQQLQVSFLHNRGSINFDMDKLSDQSITDAYFSMGVVFNFK